MSHSAPSPLARFAVAFLSAALAMVLRQLMDPALDNNLPFLFPFAAVALTSWYGGSAAAVVAAVVGYLGANYFFIPPRGEFVLGRPEMIGLVGYVSGCLVLIAFGEALHRARRRAERSALDAARQRERFRTALSSIGDAVLTLDPDGRISYLNPSAERVSGWSAAEAEAQAVEAVVHLIQEADRAPVASPALQALREGGVATIPGPTMLVARDGSEHAVASTAAPIRDQDGSVSGLVLVLRDVTEQRQLEEVQRDQQERLERQVLERTAELARSEEVFRLLVEGSRDYAIFLLDPEGRVASWNPGAENIKGYRAQEIIGQHFSRFYTEADIQDAKPARELEIARRVGKYSEEGWRVRKDGSRFWASVLITALSDSSGKLRGFSKVTRDQTLRREAEEQAAHLMAEQARREELMLADRRKDEFLAILSHELRNPLAPLRNALVLLRGHPTPAQSEEILALMERQLSQVVRLVSDLLDVSRISRGDLTLRKQPVQLSLVVASAIETSGPLFERRGHHLTVTLPEAPIWLDGDLTRLAQVFANLLNNAAKFTDPGGEIRITGERQEDEVVVTVTDSGIGIRAEMLPQVFEMFTQVDSSRERSQGGLGIGLSLVKRLVEMHGGRVVARSEGSGRGSTFEVRLPTRAASARPGDAKPEEAEAVPARRRILIVDDNHDAAFSLAQVLALAGHETRTAADGLDGLAVAESFLPEAVVMDIGLPRLNGYETCRRMRERPWSRHAVFIALTGWGQDGDRRQSAEAGFRHHLVKPVDPVELQRLMAMDAEPQPATGAG